MRYIIALLFLAIMTLMLILELTSLPFENGMEAILTMGITLSGIYLAFFALTADTKRK